MKSAPAIAFDYTPSRLILAGVLACGALAALAVVLSGLGGFLKIPLVLLALGYAGHAAWRFADCPVVRMAHGEAGWILVDRSGNEEAVELAHHIRRGVLLVLAFAAGTRRPRRFVLAPDNLDAETRRRLLLVLAAS
ncbi:hypothetical protein [Dokdonella immobilis]|uniref:Toxin CptA n=1 Tax=Dokdonella immobilis TaxID=578942 RepID=A0A1I4W115_9GAMM|nr:hypothetical protein [Dokdonella immobilis]SFN07191.1 hypothetical protein SAMN05216289_103250 [Dokdonella immobilis]